MSDTTESKLRVGIARILVKWDMPTRQVAINEILDLCAAEFLEIIGEDDPYGSTRDYRVARNELRATLRQAVKEKFGGGE